MLNIQRENALKKQKKRALYCYFQGDQSLLQYLNLRVQLTIIVDKPFVSSIPIIPLKSLHQQHSDSPFFDPLIGIQVFGENQKDYILKNKGLIKENFLYVYFPSKTKVDERTNRIYNNNFQSFLEKIPRPIKSNFAKLTIFDEGHGQQSTESQSAKCSEAFALLLKAQLQKKVENYIQDISLAIQKQISPQVLFTIFKSKLGLAHIYRKIGVNEKAQETLDLLWQDISFNQKYFIDKSSNGNAIFSPFILKDYDKIQKKFFSPDAFLQISSFCFLRSYELDIQLMNYCQAVRSLKKFAEVSFNNIIFSSRSSSQNEILKHLWIVSIIDECNEILVKLGRTHPTFLNINKQAEYNNTAVYIARTYKASIQYLGSKLYNFSYQKCYPQNMQEQIHFCLQNIQAWEREQMIKLKEAEEIKILKQKCNQNMVLIFGGFEAFKYLYLKSIINFYELLARSSNYTRMAKPAKILLLKVYLSIAPAQKLLFSQLYLKNYLIAEGDLQGYLQQIIKRAQKIIIQNEELQQINLNILRNNVKYDPNHDNFLNRNRQDETLWPSLKFIQDYYMFIILLQSYRAAEKYQKNKNQESISMSFSKITSKLPLKYDHIIHLLLDNNLIQLKNQWELTLKLARQLFLIQKSQHNQIIQTIETPVRLGILLEAQIKNQENSNILIVKLNNQQISSLKNQKQSHLIELSLLIIDLYGVQKNINLKCHALRLQKENIIELQFQLLQKQCLIFIIKEFRIKIGLILCYYINKSIELQQLHQEEQEVTRKKKKSRKYSSFQQRLQQEQFVHMVNKCEQLALKFLYFNTFDIVNCKEEEIRLRVDSRNRKSSRISKFSNKSDRDRSISQSSLYNLLKDKQSHAIVYKNVWSPITLTIKPNYQSQNYSLNILVNKMIIGAFQTEEVSEWIKIHNVWVNRSKTDAFNLTFTESKGVEITMMVRNMPTKEGKNVPKSRKGSEMSQSLFSNTSWQKGQSLKIQFQVFQENYKYNIQKTVAYSKGSSFDVKYFYSGNLQEYTMVNTSKYCLFLKNEDDQQVLLKPFQQYRLEKPNVQIEIELQNKPILQKQASPFASIVNLRNHIKKQFLRPQKLQTFQLNIKHQSIYRKMELIYIISPVKGELSILDPGQGFQFLGKIQGILQTNEQNMLNLYLMATTNGKLVLPKLMIDGKRGMWKQSTLLNIVD